MGTENKTPKYGVAAIAIAMACIIAIASLTGCDSAKSEAQEAFKAAVTALEEKNAEIDTAIADLQGAIGADIKPLDEATTKAAEEAISAAQGAKVSAPDMANETDAIKEQTEKLEQIDYAKQLDAISKAKSDLESSIKQRQQVTNPDEAFVIQRLTGIEHIETPTAVTEDNDPNGQLHKQGGYTATVYFLSDLVDQSLVYGDDVIGKGTDGGGAVEVYANEDDANKRDTYLSAFDGTSLASGSHHVCGTCLIRTSNELAASQQADLEAAIIEALTRLE